MKETTFERVMPSYHQAPPLTPLDCDSPYKYFKLYFTPNLMQLIAEKTNVYAHQNNIQLFVTESDIEDFVALHILMGIYKFPRIRMYWEKTVNLPIFAETMSRDRFFRIRTCIHAVDNLAKPASAETDVFWKVRPFFDAVRHRCNELVMEENLAVDEQMIPFTGHHRAKQYIRGKPCPWGFKLFVICGKSGTAYDFLVYQGSSTELNKEDTAKFGYGGAVVVDGEGECGSFRLLRQLLHFLCLAAWTSDKRPEQNRNHKNQQIQEPSIDKWENPSKEGAWFIRWGCKQGRNCCRSLGGQQTRPLGIKLRWSWECWACQAGGRKVTMHTKK